jgi:hypothetical protein
MPDPNATAQKCTFTEYGKKECGSLALRIQPNATTPGHQSPAWTAVLIVKSLDIPRLMRDGFFWSADNILPEEGYMGHTLEREWTARGFHHSRNWTLADKAAGHESPRWVARLQILAPSVELLSRFRVQTLSRDHVCNANACDALGRMIYNYNRYSPASNYNCIYDDKALQGWWPWPGEKEAYQLRESRGEERGQESGWGNQRGTTRPPTRRSQGRSDCVIQ